MKCLTMLVAFWCAFIVMADDNQGKKMEFIAVEHASFIIKTPKLVIYVDPVGTDRYTKHGKPDLILVTHGHFDHFAPDLLKAIKTPHTIVIAPAAVNRQLGFGESMKNGDTKMVKGLKIEAIGAYNLTRDRLKFHPKSVGNGYVLTIDGQRIYISGDTEDVPEMRALKNIDYAFVCMNLPYTMTVEQAAAGVLAFKPKIVYPYHYRGRPNMSDIDRFKRLVAAKNPAIKVRFLNWYGQASDRTIKREAR